MNDYDFEQADTRLDAYIEMLKTVYGVDEHGLADMLGIKRQTWTKFRKAPLPNKGGGTIIQLALVTGIDIDWLLCEAGYGKEVAS